MGRKHIISFIIILLIFSAAEFALLTKQRFQSENNLRKTHAEQLDNKTKEYEAMLTERNALKLAADQLKEEAQKKVEVKKPKPFSPTQIKYLCNGTEKSTKDCEKQEEPKSGVTKIDTEEGAVDWLGEIQNNIDGGYGRAIIQPCSTQTDRCYYIYPERIQNEK